MIKKARIAGLCLVALVVSTGGAYGSPDDERGPLYVISAHFILLTESQAVELSKESTVQDKSPVRGLRFGDNTLELGEEILWNGSPDWPEEDSSFTILSSPRVTTLAERKVKLRTSVSSSPQYFEPTDDGTYRVRTLDKDEGPRIDIEVTSFEAPPDADGHSRVDVDFALDLVLLGDRQPLPGVSLDVGKPTVVAKKVSSTMRMRTGYWDIISCYLAKGHKGFGDTASADVFLVLIRVDLHP